MAKGERRRRRLLEQDGSSAELGSETQASEAAAPQPFGRQQPASETPFSSAAAESTSEQQPQDGSGGDAASSAPRPIALAEILAKPRTVPRGSGPRQQRASFTPAETEEHTEGQPQSSAASPATEPARDPFFAAPAERFAANSRPSEEAVQDTGPQFVPPGIAETAPSPRGRRTNEPVLLALLLVVLVVLAFDTYFTLRLNGLSDRLAVVASRSAATATPVAAGERPWVGVDSVKTQPFANGGQPVTTVHIVNSGREPAYDLRSNTVGSLRSATTPAPEIPAQKGPLATTGLLLPNTGGNLTFFANTRALTADEANNVRSGQYVLWLAGRLDYKDSKGHPHLTSFRYRYDSGLGGFIAAPNGNLAN